MLGQGGVGGDAATEPALPVLPAPPTGEPAARPYLSVEDIEQRRKAARLASAQSIRPGCSMHEIATWAPKERKPQVFELKAVMAARFPDVRCNAWDVQKIATYLFEHAPPKVVFVHAYSMAYNLHFMHQQAAALPKTAEDSDSDEGSEVGDGSGDGDASGSAVEDPKARWNSAMAVRTINAIVATKPGFLNSEKTMSSDLIDAGKHKAYWEELAEFVRNPKNELVLSGVFPLPL